MTMKIILMMMMMMIMMMMMMMMMMTMVVLMMLAHGLRPPRGGDRAQRDTVLKLIAIHFTEIQN